MKSEILSVAKPEEWQIAVAETGLSDVYFHPGYVGACAAEVSGAGEMFVARRGNSVFAYPYIRRRIDSVGGHPVEDTWYDIETPYGYGGPIGNDLNGAFLDDAWSAFVEAADAVGVVAEFTRFHPLLENERFAAPDCTVVDNRETVVVDLEAPPERLLASYGQNHRYMINRAKRSGIVVREDRRRSAVGRFARLYRDHMVRLGAEEAFSFSDDYFSRLFDGLGTSAVLFLAFAEDEASDPIGGILLMIGDRLAHYHLSATAPLAARTGVTNLLLHEACLYCRSRTNVRRIHMGGGRTTDPEDTLLKFKQRISKVTCRYRIGLRVLDRERYDRLASLYRDRTGKSPPSILQFYRHPVVEH